MRASEEAAVLGKFLVDLFPICMSLFFPRFPSSQLCHIVVVEHVPEWMPGAGFKRQARIWRRITDRMYEEPFRVVKDALVSNTCSSRQ